MEDNTKSLQLEYQCLRDEILKRVELRNTIVTFSVTAAGSMLSLSIQHRELALIYPFIALFFCCMWAQNDMRELQLCDYVSILEDKLHMGWSEFYKKKQGQGSFFRGIPISVVIPGGLFIATSLIAVFLARTQIIISLARYLCFLCDCISILFMAYFVSRISIERLGRRRTKNKQTGTRE